MEKKLHHGKHITPPDNCTGCGLCANVCGKNAITLTYSSLGFLVPEVDVERCIHCGLCVHNCPALTEASRPLQTDVSMVQSYAVWNQDTDIHRCSSSGGVFTALAEHVIDEAGCVFGVAWKDTSSLHFIKAETRDDLQAMRGSKYLQANPGYVYRDIQKELKKKRKVVFFGTPCQVHALKKYVKRDKEYLTCVDLVCHGVPSHFLIEKYIQECESRSGHRVASLHFRDKSDSWNRFNMRRLFVDKSEEKECFKDDVYMRLFLSDKLLNKACYNCPFAQIPRQGDLSVGDYWGVEKFHSEWPIKLGISSLIINTDKGAYILQQLRDKLHIHREDFANIYQGQPSVYVRPMSRVPKERTHYIHSIAYRSLSDLLNQAINYTQIGLFFVRNNSPLLVFARKVKRKLNKWYRAMINR